jgi:hypothetical protein
MRWAVCLAIALGSVACTSTHREAASLIEAVDRYRKAEMNAKGPLADALAKVPCSAAEVCAAKEACLATARPTVKGMALKAEVEAALGALRRDGGSLEGASSKGLVQTLDQATGLLEEGEARLPACDARVTALRLEYGP